VTRLALGSRHGWPRSPAVLLALLLLAPPAAAAGGREPFHPLPATGWRFATLAPPVGWNTAGFDDQSWQTYDRRPKVPPEAVAAIHAEVLNNRKAK
jgi:hypothetical protein